MPFVPAAAMGRSRVQVYMWWPRTGCTIAEQQLYFLFLQRPAPAAAAMDMERDAADAAAAGSSSPPAGHFHEQIDAIGMPRPLSQRLDKKAQQKPGRLDGCWAKRHMPACSHASPGRSPRPSPSLSDHLYSLFTSQLTQHSCTDHLAATFQQLLLPKLVAPSSPTFARILSPLFLSLHIYTNKCSKIHHIASN